MSEKIMLSECRILEAKIIRENSNGIKKLKIAGKFQEAEEPNNNKRRYRKPILESAVNNLQDKIKDRSLVGALDHPPNDTVHLSQASHLITKLYMKGNEVMGEAEILSTPSGKVVQALIEDGVKLGISSRGVGSLTEGKDGISEVNDDFKLVTFDIVADPSTKGAFASLTESVKQANTQKVEKVINKFQAEKVLEVLLMDKINKIISEAHETDDEGTEVRYGKLRTYAKKKDKDEAEARVQGAHKEAAIHNAQATRARTRVAGRTGEPVKLARNLTQKLTPHMSKAINRSVRKNQQYLQGKGPYKDIKDSTILDKYNKLINEMYPSVQTQKKIEQQWSKNTAAKKHGVTNSHENENLPKKVVKDSKSIQDKIKKISKNPTNETILDKYRRIITEKEVDSNKDRKKDYNDMVGKGEKGDKEQLNLKVNVKNPPKSPQTPGKGKIATSPGIDKSVKVGKGK